MKHFTLSNTLTNFKFTLFILSSQFLGRSALDLEEVECLLREKNDRSNCPGMQSFLPWPLIESCRKYDVKIFPKGTFHPKSVSSFPSSGLEWLLRMIEKCTGVLTENLEPYLSHNDPQYGTRCSLKLNNKTGRTIVQGDFETLKHLVPYWYLKLLHVKNFGSSLSNNSGILLIRNPWHAIVNTRADLRRSFRICTTCKHSRVLDQERDFNPNHFKTYFDKAARMWVDHTKAWVKRSRDGSKIIIVSYENLIADPELQLRRILTYLNQSVDEGRLKCTLDDSKRLKEHFSEHNPRNLISAFFAGKQHLRSSEILKNGIEEIYEMLRLQNSSMQINYKRPFPSDVLTMRDSYFTRYA